jgi:hypothetical protein
MTLLISSIQYKNFEIGEFTEQRERNFKETLEIINQFPWETQRENISISITNPSVTIQGKNGDYLKLALFYGGKFVLYYFDKDAKLYTKSFSILSDAYQYIGNYFDSPVFDKSGFKKENTLFQKNLKHFLKQDFRYELTPKSIRNYFLLNCGMNLVLGAGFIFLIFFRYEQLQALGVILMIGAIFFIGGGINLVVFFSHYLHARGKVLIMSKGNEMFFFGNKENPDRYKKADIIRITISKLKDRKHAITGFAVVTLELSSGKSIDIPNILLDHLVLEYKLPGIAKVEENRLYILKW